MVSRRRPIALILDCGSKTLTADGARGFTPTPGHGVVFAAARRPDAPDPHCSSSGCRRSTPRCASRPGGQASEPGDRVRVLPNHACVVSNLVDEVRLVDGDVVVDTLPVAARGKIQ